MYAGRRPSLLQQGLKIGIAQRPELVDETDTGKELRVPRESLFDSGISAFPFSVFTFQVKSIVLAGFGWPGLIEQWFVRQ